MKKGFTLIELLAVIVILAIIAVIAVPIVLRIINESKENSYKRSIEMYQKAVENAIASYILSFPEDKNIKEYKLYKKYNGKKDFIEYDGKDIDCDIKIYSAGGVYITNCKIDGQEVLAEDSTKENKKYYSAGEETVEAHIGEYVNYVATGTSYTGKWRILGMEDGHILLLSDSVGKLDLQGKDGWTNGPSRMNTMASVYATGTKAISARSINTDDINKLLGYNPYKDGSGMISLEGDAKEYGNVITYSYKDGSIYYKASNGLEGTQTKYTSFEDFDGTIISSEYLNNTVTHTVSYLQYNIKTLIYPPKSGNAEEIGAPTNSPIYNMITTDQTYWLADQQLCGNPSRVSWHLRLVMDGNVDGRPLYHSFDDDDQTLYSYNVRSVVTLDESAKLVYDEENSIWNIE